MTVISKAGLAAELRVSKARISQYLKGGMPERPDGKLDREVALHWVKSNRTIVTGTDKGAERAAKLSAEAARRKPKETNSVAAVPKGYEAARLPKTDFEAGMVYGALFAIYRVGALASVMSVNSGAAVKVAYATEGAVTLGLMMAFQDLFKRNGVAPFDKDDDAFVFDAECMHQVNWQHMAKVAGEPYDVEAWERWKRELHEAGNR